MSQVLAVLQAVRARLAHPRSWVKFHWSAHRDEYGAVHRLEANDSRPANCWCLGQAITLAILELSGPSGGGSQTTGADVVRFTELRSDVERVLLQMLEDLGIVDRDTGRPFPAVYVWQDRPSVSHTDLLGLLDRTLYRLNEVSRNPESEATYDEVEALAEADVKAGVVGRQLEGRLADYQSEYEEYWQVARVAPPSN